jgi:hypothetical protein
VIPTWRGVLTVGIVVAAAELAAVATGMDPQLALVGALVVACCTIGWAVRAVALSAATPVSWPGPLPDVDVSTDWQVAALRSRIAYGSEDRSADDQLRATLVRLVDERLRAEHGVDRHHDPERAKAVLGDELYAFTTDPTGTRRHGRRKDLERIVSLIETT